MPVAAIYVVATGFLSVNVHRGTSHGGLNETVLRRSLAGHGRRFNKPPRNKIGDQMKKNRPKNEKGSEQRFVFTKNEIIQLWDQQGRKGMLVASTLADAEKFAAWMKTSRGEELTIAEIETEQGMEDEFEHQVAAGAKCLYMVQFDGDQILFRPLLSTNWTIPFGVWLESDPEHPIPIEALFDETWTRPNLAKDPRRTFADAQVIFGVDVMSQREFLVYGRKILEQIVKSGTTQEFCAMWVAIDQETDELEKLLALVKVLKGHDDYKAG